MGFLDRLKASQNTGLASWKDLLNIEQLKEIDTASNDKPIAIFKHSTTCGISAGAKHRLEIDWENLEGDIDFYYLDLLSHRSVSNEIAIHYGVRHESPQLIIIKNGKAIYNTSHHRISISDLNSVLDKTS